MSKGTLPFTYFQGQVRPAEQAMISIASHSLQYGTTCFGGIRGYHQGDRVVIFRLQDHYERLMNSSKIMGLGFSLPYEEFHGIIGELIARNRPKGDFYIRPFIYSGTCQLAPRLSGLSFELAIYFVDMGAYFAPTKGIRLGISSWRKFSDQALPTKAKAGGCYINSTMATSDALHNGYDEALLADNEGNIVEASVANILLVYRDRILSPPMGSPMLEGITLRSMVSLLAEEDRAVSFERIDRSMVYTCQEMMLLGTAAQLTFVASVDGRVIRETPGPICQLLRDKFAHVIAGRHPLSKEWVQVFSL